MLPITYKKAFFEIPWLMADWLNANNNIIMARQKNIFITGATDGIGRALAINYRAKGQQVWMLGRKPLTELDQSFYTPSNYVQADLALPNAAERVRQFLATQPVRYLDLFIHNAGTPPALTIYFLRTDGNERYALETESGWTRYVNSIPIGHYFVFARVTGDKSNFGGGFTRAVECGLTANCNDHDLIPVEIEDGKTARGIDITDWYAPAGTFPLSSD